MMPSQSPQRPNQQQSPQQVFEQARRMLALGDAHEAAQRAALLRSHFPNETPMVALHGLAVAALGLHELAIGDLSAAADATERALKERASDDVNLPRIADQLIRLSTQLARSFEAVGMRGEADAALDRALGVDPEDPFATQAKVEILAGRGATDEARAFLDEANRLGLEELPAAMSAAAVALARRDTSADEFRMLGLRLKALTEAVGLDAVTQSDALRRCGELFDRAGERDEAFRAFTRAANFKRGAFDAAAHARVTSGVMSVWTASAMDKVKKPETGGAGIVFVVSAPCAGGVELGRAMAGHKSVATAGPSEVLTMAALRAAGAKGTKHRPVVTNPSQLRGAQLGELAEMYAAQTKRNAQPKGRAVVVDSCPLHAHLVGLAAMAMPEARFVFVRREARSNALACYFGATPGHHPYAKELGTTASYLRDIRGLMDHWSAVLGSMGRSVVETTREALAADPDGETARVMQAAGIDGAAPGPVFAPSAADHPEHYAKRLEPYEAFLAADGAGAAAG